MVSQLASLITERRTEMRVSLSSRDCPQSLAPEVDKSIAELAGFLYGLSVVVDQL